MIHLYTLTMLSHRGYSKQQINELNRPKQIPLDACFFDALTFIDKAISNHQKIFVAGDFDADGICSTAILVRMLKLKKADVGFYIPDRLKEGYGLSTEIAQSAIDKGYDLFIMVDNGVSLFDVHALLRKHNKQSIIIDHHTISEACDVDVLIHPDVLDPYYDRLCGAGLSYCLTQAANLDDDVFLQLAAVATIGDMMPLVAFNRHLVRKGLDVLNNHPMVHFSNLIKKQVMDEEDVAYQIVPKLNAVGRLSDIANVNNVVSFLLNEETSQVLSFIEALEDINQTRKDMLKDMEKIAQDNLSDDPFNFVIDANFHQGIVGILAGQLTRQTNKPTLVATIQDDLIKGSLRSIDVDLYGLLSGASDYVRHFGGHAKAAGIELHVDQLEAFKKRVLETLDNHRMDTDESNAIELDPALIDMVGVKEFESYRPFGMDFERPVVKLNNVKVLKTQHLPKHNLSKWVLEVNGLPIEAITFDQVELSTQQASQVHVTGTLAYKPYNGYDKIVLRIEKIWSSNSIDA